MLLKELIEQLNNYANTHPEMIDKEVFVGEQQVETLYEIDIMKGFVGVEKDAKWRHWLSEYFVEEQERTKNPMMMELLDKDLATLIQF